MTQFRMSFHILPRNIGRHLHEDQIAILAKSAIPTKPPIKKRSKLTFSPFWDWIPFKALTAWGIKNCRLRHPRTEMASIYWRSLFLTFFRSHAFHHISRTSRDVEKVQCRGFFPAFLLLLALVNCPHCFAQSRVCAQQSDPAVERMIVSIVTDREWTVFLIFFSVLTKRCSSVHLKH